MSPTFEVSSKESVSDSEVECYEGSPGDTPPEDIMDNVSDESPKEYRLYRQRFVGLVALVRVALLYSHRLLWPHR